MSEDGDKQTAQHRLQQQLAFILEADRLKQVIRRSYLVDASRLENSAEHSWHLALMALVLQEHANEEVSLLRVLQMVVIHDLVEIDCGDTYLFDDAAQAGKLAREELAAARLFGLLPPDQAAEFYALWQEFEARETADARFANALDRLIPLLHNYHSRGRSWQEHGIRSQQVRDRLASIDSGSVELWSYAEALIEAAVAEGILES
ncbi:MAG: HD domain-containing protein [Chloroflexi bacterium]|nr:HD domain-containing protein [Chloroflexota bacterium]